VRLVALVAHTNGVDTYHVGDHYEIADDLTLGGSPMTIAETIIAGGMARRDDPPAPPVDHRGEPTKHRKASL
jgi:hypothetical protein